MVKRLRVLEMVVMVRFRMLISGFSLWCGVICGGGVIWCEVVVRLVTLGGGVIWSKGTRPMFCFNLIFF
jgi:hypothetical protein